MYSEARFHSIQDAKFIFQASLLFLPYLLAAMPKLKGPMEVRLSQRLTGPQRQYTFPYWESVIVPRSFLRCEPTSCLAMILSLILRLPSMSSELVGLLVVVAWPQSGVSVLVAESRRTLP
jgi:hypothetical protein